MIFVGKYCLNRKILPNFASSLKREQLSSEPYKRKVKSTKSTLRTTKLNFKVRHCHSLVTLLGKQTNTTVRGFIGRSDYTSVARNQ